MDSTRKTHGNSVIHIQHFYPTFRKVRKQSANFICILHHPFYPTPLDYRNVSTSTVYTGVLIKILNQVELNPKSKAQTTTANFRYQARFIIKIKGVSVYVG